MARLFGTGACELCGILSENGRCGARARRYVATTSMEEARRLLIAYGVVSEWNAPLMAEAKWAVASTATHRKSSPLLERPSGDSRGVGDES
jgi:hypothetical protein